MTLCNVHLLLMPLSVVMYCIVVVLKRCLFTSGHVTYVQKMCMYAFMNWYDVTCGKHVYTYIHIFSFRLFSSLYSLLVFLSRMVFWGHFAEDGGDIDASEDLEGF